MIEVINTIAHQLLQNSLLELVAVVFAVAYLVLAVKENSLCWYAAGISTLIFLFIFWDVKLYMESGLQIYYLAMAFYGWYQWRGAQTETVSLRVSKWRAKQHVVALALIATLTFVSGSLLNSGTDANLPYLDSFTTWASVVTTFMVARKILENWFYWLVIDSVSIYLYLDRELYFTSLLFAIYIVIIFFGWFAWNRSYRQREIEAY
ncbi:nicotinamide riboside transporter PnuC [Gammaproteobacteria bacterium]|nr:nicotinamide riboside transporter PnuC [bacterium]MDA9783504.1 nicotinamide riboside transporter PnuC [Gammaproteobacteria bacterium]MDC3362099.1 nicotinamide riboside transporter PnuC [Gammaproteobacteria bacterium]